MQLTAIMRFRLLKDREGQCSIFMKVQFVCNYCGDIFKRYPRFDRPIRNKFCSRICNDKGRNVWNRGLTKKDPRVAKAAFAAHNATRGKPAWNKGLTKETDERVLKYIRTEEKHHQWKGDMVGYEGLHDWVSRQLGNAFWCFKCMSVNDISTIYDWANISREYKRNLTDWICLCRKCHKGYDGEYKAMNNIY